MQGVEHGKLFVTAAGMISRKHAATALGVKPKTLCEWKAKGLGPVPVRVGGRVFYRWSEVLALAHGEAWCPVTN